MSCSLSPWAVSLLVQCDSVPAPDNCCPFQLPVQPKAAQDSDPWHNQPPSRFPTSSPNASAPLTWLSPTCPPGLSASSLFLSTLSWFCKTLVFLASAPQMPTVPLSHRDKQRTAPTGPLPSRGARLPVVESCQNKEKP